MKKIYISLLVVTFLALGTYLYISNKQSDVTVNVECNRTENVYINTNLGYQITVPANWKVEVGQGRDRFSDCNGVMDENNFQIVKDSLYTTGRKKIREISNLIPGAVVSEWLSSEIDNPGYKYEISFPTGEKYSLFPIFPNLKIEQYPFVSTFQLLNSLKNRSQSTGVKSYLGSSYSFSYPSDWDIWEINPSVGHTIVYPRSKSDQVMNKTISTTDRINISLINSKEMNLSDTTKVTLNGETWYVKIYKGPFDGGSENESISYFKVYNSTKYVDINSGMSNKLIVELIASSWVQG